MVKIEDIVRLDDKDFLPEKKEKWKVINKKTKEVINIIGDTIQKNKMIENISSGYVYYFRTEEGLKKYSAFNYDIEKDES